MRTLVRIGLAMACLAGPVAFADAPGWLAEGCGGCHALERPDYDTLGIEERLQRKGPPLYYAGNKFRSEWLQHWLQNPERLRPAGYYPPAVTVQGEEFDVVDGDRLVTHPVLDTGRAREAAEFLMGLKPNDQLLAATLYEPGTIAARMGQMNFTKFNGCDACHSDEPGYGGMSGPELYSAWQRLQPAFIASVIADPVAWDPHTLMPAAGLNTAAVERLANYLRLIGEEYEAGRAARDPNDNYLRPGWEETP